MNETDRIISLLTMIHATLARIERRLPVPVNRYVLGEGDVLTFIGSSDAKVVPIRMGIPEGEGVL